MAVDLSAYVDNLKREINPPGVVLDANATDDELAGHLSDAYWEAVLDGIDFIRNNFNGPDVGATGDTIVTPISVGGAEFPRDLIQLVILYAGIRIIKARLLNLKTQFSAKAGPVSFEYQQSTQMFQAVYKDLLQRRVITLRRLSDVGILPVLTFNSNLLRTDNIYTHEDFWVR